MLIRYRCRDYPDKWVLQRSDLNPETHQPFPRDFLAVEPARGELVGPPPSDSPKWYYQSKGGYWRQEPARKWSLAREWLHLAVAVGAVGVAGLCEWLTGGWFWPTLIVLLACFSLYEVVESFRIRDRAYRDLLGFKVGLFLAIPAAAAVLEVLKHFGA